jgi:hypothetical protein
VNPFAILIFSLGSIRAALFDFRFTVPFLNETLLVGQLSSVPETNVSYTETSVSVPPLSAVRNGSIKRSRRESGSGIRRKTSLGEKTGNFSFPIILR